MDAEVIATLTGLFFDILGVGVLFYSTSARKLELEIIVPTMRDFMPKEGEEIPYLYNAEEEEQRQLAAECLVRRNRRLQRVALAWIMLGFALQSAGLFV